jgi:hypothetical protein
MTIMNIDYVFKGYINAKETGFKQRTTLVPSQAESVTFQFTGKFCVFLPEVFEEPPETWTARYGPAKLIIAVAVLVALLLLRSRPVNRIGRKIRKGALFCINRGTRVFSL